MDIPIVFVWKEVQGRLAFVQGRRVGCQLCRQPFTYLVWGQLEEKSVGLPLVSSTDEMRERNWRGFKYQLTRVARQPRAGYARCPHCHGLQPWMRRRVIGDWLFYSGSAAVLLAVGLPFAIVRGIPDLARYGQLFTWSLLGTLAVAVAFSLVGWWRTRPSAARAGRRAKTDAELRELLAAHAAVAQALNAWLAELDGRSVLPTYCLALRDEVEPSLVPPGWRTADILPALDPFA